jgi:type II secretory ATPase GspE/PulE/Tfp pilus assembly ATPase PilB-like protein
VEITQIPRKYFQADFNPTQPVFYHGTGCVRCKGTGYVGRVAIAELFLFNASARKLVERGFPLEEARAEAKKQEMITLRQDAILKALAGLTTLEEVFRVSQESDVGEEERKLKERS